MSFEHQKENELFVEIALEIKNMVQVDQEMRSRSQVEDYWDETVDAKNTKRMKEIVAKIGWPTISKVGKEGAHDAWLLIQHSDRDVNFQAQCLQLMKDVPENEVDKINIAYLEDRVRVNQGRGQLYGTQFNQEHGKHVPKTIEDKVNIDLRRAEIGMGPLSEQIQDMYEKYPFEKK